MNIKAVYPGQDRPFIMEHFTGDKYPSRGANPGDLNMLDKI